MPQLFANNASAKLLNSITASSTTITLQAGQGAKFRVAVWPNYMKVTLEDPAKNTEVIRVTRASGSDSLQVVDENGNVSANGRAQEGTTARAFSAGYLCELRLTAEALNDFSAKVDRSGDTMTGALSLPGDPSDVSHAARKGYVDSEVSAARDYAEALGTSRVTVNDTTPGLLTAKLQAGAKFGVGNPGANEVLYIPVVPTGAIIDFPCANAPAGYVALSGQLLSRAAEPALWAFAQASGNITATDAAWFANRQDGSFSPGDGATTFRVPDFRGLYRRAIDAGRGLSSMATLGKYYADENKSHTHTASFSGTANAVADHTHQMRSASNAAGGGTAGQMGGTTGGNPLNYTLPAGGHSHTVTGVVTVNGQGSTEVTVKTATVLTCIKT